MALDGAAPVVAPENVSKPSKPVCLSMEKIRGSPSTDQRCDLTTIRVRLIITPMSLRLPRCSICPVTMQAMQAMSDV